MRISDWSSDVCSSDLPGFLGKHQPRQVIALGILLPVDEMLIGRDLQRIRKNARAAVGRRAQANDQRTELDSAVVSVMRDMVQCDVNRHDVPPASLGVIARERKSVGKGTSVVVRGGLGGGRNYKKK